MTSGQRIAVVTGAASGLGRQVTLDLRAAGFEVVAVDVQPDPEGRPIEPLDIRDASACRDLANRVQPWAWINCAGILGAGDAATQPDDEIERVVAVNLLGTMHATRAAVASMRSGTGEGRVVTIASLGAWVPVPGECVYAATKAGVLSFTLGLRAELAAQGVRGIELSVVCPDGMLTPMISDRIDDPAIALTFSGPRLATVEEVSARVLRLLDQPRAIASVPRWRGAMVRLLGAVPDAGMRALPVFERIGSANQAKARALLQHARDRQRA